MDKTAIYFLLKILFSGLVLFAMAHFLYIYIEIPRKRTRAALIITFVATLYVLSDVLVQFFTIIIPRQHLASILTLVKKLVPLLFLFLAPFFINRLYVFKGVRRKINNIFYMCGITAAIVFAVMITTGITRDSVTLRVIEVILFTVYLLYSIIIIVISEMHTKSTFPVKNILAGLVIISYMVFYNIYLMLFTPGGTGILTGEFPHGSLGVSIFILFMSFAMTDVSIISGLKLANMQNMVRKSLYHDPALGVPNRICFKKDILEYLDSSLDVSPTMAVFFMDVDDFQNINESYGETVGNRLLMMLAQRMEENFSADGTLYRIGGDEFAFLLKGVEAEKEAADFAMKILSSMRKPFILSNESYTITVSIAILLVPRDGSDPDTIISNAYSTIRNVKKNKNSYVFFDSNLLEGSTRKIHIVNMLRNCIVRDQFVLHYQPIVDADGKLVYAEALLRCESDNPEIGGPGSFIPLIQKAGLMKDLDSLVVRKAFYDMEMKIENRFGISINMSAEQLADPAYDEFLFSFARQHSIDPRKLILEITETTLVENIMLARESLGDLKRKGFLIAIDDFGKGFSSLTYLAELPVDILKIDMAFVHTVPGDRKKEMLARYIIDLGRSLNLTVLAEGFEKPEQVHYFRKHGCALFQGYYFSRPVPLDELLHKYSYV